MSQDLWDLVEGGYEEPATPEAFEAWNQAKHKEYRECKMKDAKALLFILQWVSKSIFPRIMDATKAIDAWEILKKDFQGSNRIICIKLQSLWREFDNLKMK